MCSFTDSVIQTFPHISWKYLSHRTCSLDKHRAGQGIPADEGGFSSFSSLLCFSGALVAFIEVKMAHFTVEITARSSKKEHTGTAPGHCPPHPPYQGVAEPVALWERPDSSSPGSPKPVGDPCLREYPFPETLFSQKPYKSRLCIKGAALPFCVTYTGCHFSKQLESRRW